MLSIRKSIPFCYVLLPSVFLVVHQSNPTLAFTLPASSISSINSKSTSRPLSFTNKPHTPHQRLAASTQEDNEELDSLLEKGNLGAVRQLLQSNPNLVSLANKQRWLNIFNAIEEQTAQAEESLEYVNTNTRRAAEFPTTSQARTDMTQLYQTLKNNGQLQVYGAINLQTQSSTTAAAQEPIILPAAGSYSVRPSLLEQVTGLPMKALTPKPSNALLYAGVGVAVLEFLVSLALGINANVLALATIAAFATDRLLLNGAIVESAYKLINPGVQLKIQRHEAGHFLAAYLLGCPVEGCVLDAWAALKDARFGAGRQVTAGTSFFDPILSQQINEQGGKVTRSSIDRYSIIVMAGIAAEAIYYGQADGGAGDEMALIAFLSQMNGSGGGTNPSWNNVTIRNQARWGALQAVLLLREYKPCYEALVQALDEGGSLGECIHAIEKAAQDNQLGPLRKPLGYIVELAGDEEKWTTEKPPPEMDGLSMANIMSDGKASALKEPVDPQESLSKLNEYRQEMEEKLKAIDDKLDRIGTSSKD